MTKLLELLTGDDNSTMEPSYFWSAVVIVVGLGLQIYSTVTGGSFNLSEYGIGAGAMLAGLGLSAKIGK